MIACILVHMCSPQSAIYCDTVIMHIEYRVFSMDSIVLQRATLSIYILNEMFLSDW
jgi:hypothetical protein